MFTKVNNLLKTRQSKEVGIHELAKKNQECFNKAINKEVTNNFDIGAYEKVSQEDPARVRSAMPEKILESRYVLTAKRQALEPIDVELPRMLVFCKNGIA